MSWQRFSWGRAFAFSALAVGAPWAICATIAVTLVVLPGEAEFFGVQFLAISPAGAVAGILVGGSLAHRWPPRTRGGAARQTLLACVLAIGVVAIVMAVIGLVDSGNPSVFPLAVIAFGGASAVFIIGGGGVWAAAGGIAASRLMSASEPMSSRWVPFGWMTLGALGAIGSVLYAVADHGSDDSDLSGAAGRGPWQWFPLGWMRGWGIYAEYPGWFPTLALANALGFIAVGIAKRVSRAERVELPRENRLFP